MSKTKLLIIFILGIIGLSSLQVSYAEPSVVHSSIDNMQNKYANNLLRVNLVKTVDNKINLILHTTKSFEHTIYPIKKNDFEYIILLPETYHSITSKPDFVDLIEDIRDIQVNLVPYIGIKTNNGYTKIVVQTKKRDVDLIVSNESLELAKVLDKELDSVFDLKANGKKERTIDDITPVPLEKPEKTKTIKVSKKTKKTSKKVVKTYRKPVKKAVNKTVKKAVKPAVAKTTTKVLKPVSQSSKPKVEPKKVIEVVKKEPEKQPEIQPDVKAQSVEPKVVAKPEPKPVVKKKRVPHPHRQPKQSPLAGLLGNKWLWIIGVPLLLILLVMRNTQKAVMNRPEYESYEGYPQDDDYEVDEDELNIPFSEEEELNPAFEQEQQESLDSGSKLFAGVKKEMRTPHKEPLEDPELDAIVDIAVSEEIAIQGEEELVQKPEKEEIILDIQDNDDILFDEEEIILEDEAEVSAADEFEEIVLEEDSLEEVMPETLEDFEEVVLEEDTPIEDRVSQEEFDAILEEPSDEVVQEEDDYEEEFSLDVQNDLYEEIEVKEEFLLDPDIVTKAFDEVQSRNVQAQAPNVAIEAVPQVKPEVVPQVAVATNPVKEEKSVEVQPPLPIAGLDVLDSKMVDVNKGFYLVKLEDQKALIGFINNEYDVLHRFKNDVVAELRVKKTEEKPNEAIYLVEAKPWKALISVSDKSMKTKLIL